MPGRAIPPCAWCDKPARMPARVVLDGLTFCGWDCADEHHDNPDEYQED